MVRLFSLAVLLLVVWSLAECLVAPRDQVRLLPKLVWIVLILLLLPIGAIGWFLLGRPRPDGAAARIGRPGPAEGPGRRTPPRRIRGPDDDPDFLRGL